MSKVWKVSTIISWLLLFLTLNKLQAAEIEFTQADLGPFGKTSSITIIGEIVANDYTTITELVGGMLYDPSLRLHVVLNSPGGAMVAGLKIATFLQSLPITVTSSVRNEDKPGYCASACAIIYLGGTYRFLPENSLIGLHQFSTSSNSNLTLHDGVSIAQELAADILKVVEAANVNNSFLYEMVNAQPDEMNWLNKEKLTDLNLVNNNILYERAEFKVMSGMPYLRLQQQSYYGESKLLFACENEAPLLASFIQPTDLENFKHGDHEFFFVLNGIPMPPKDVIKEIKGTRWAQTYFNADDYQLKALAAATSVGARHELREAGVFVGFEYKLNSDTREKIFSIIDYCEEVSKEKIGSEKKLFYPMINSDFRGGDFDESGVRDVSRKQCVSICKEILQCKGISYVENRKWCWPKFILNEPISTPGVTSVIVRD